MYSFDHFIIYSSIEVCPENNLLFSKEYEYILRNDGSGFSVSQVCFVKLRLNITTMKVVVNYFLLYFSLRKNTRRQQIRQVITDLGVLYLNTMILHAIKTSTCYQHTFSDVALLSQSLMATLSYSHIQGCTAHFIEITLE